MVIMPKPAANMPAPGPTAMPVEAQAADAAPVAVDAAQEAGHAVDAAVAETAVAEAAAAAAAADAAIGSANRPETLIQIYAADGRPLLSPTLAALARLQRDAGTAGQTAVGKRGRAAAAGNVVAG